MKLLQKTVLYLLIVAVLVAILGGLLNEYIHRQIVYEIDELLLSDLQQI